MWQLGSTISNFTLEGHDKGVNCVDYYHGGDKPYLISGADDRLVKIWDYQNKTCVQTLEGRRGARARGRGRGRGVGRGADAGVLQGTRRT